MAGRASQADREWLDRAALGAMTMVRALSEAHDQHLRDAESFASDSPASADAAAPGLRSHIKDLLGKVHMSGAAALDNAHFVATNAHSWATGESTYVYVPLVAARAAIENLAMLNWLAESGLDPLVRVKRHLSVRQEMESVRRFDREHGRARIERIDEQARAIGLEPKSRGRTMDFGTSVPNRSELVMKLVDVNLLYPLLSAASHGEGWALLALGYAPDPALPTFPDHTMLAKDPSLGTLAGIVFLTCLAMAKAGAAELIYRGWLSDEFEAARTQALQLLRPN